MGRRAYRRLAFRLAGVGLDVDDAPRLGTLPSVPRFASCLSAAAAVVPAAALGVVCSVSSPAQDGPTSRPARIDPRPPALATLPSMSCETVDGQATTLPGDLLGDWNLLLIAYERWQQQEVDTWVELGKGLEAKYANFRWYEMPVLPEMTEARQTTVNMGMRMGIGDPDLRARTLTLFVDRDAFLERLGRDDMEHVHVALADRTGAIRWFSRGERSEEGARELEGLVARLARPRPEAEAETVLALLETDERFANLLTAAEESRLEFVFSAPGPITVFAPTDAAFAAWAGERTIEEVFEDRRVLREVFTRHVVRGHVDRTMLGARESLFTVSLKRLLVATSDGAPTVVGVRIVDSIPCGNGVVHVVDAVLPDPVAAAEARARAAAEQARSRPTSRDEEGVPSESTSGPTSRPGGDDRRRR
jgi:uncharacterized surface protein with fasciclin (FAS1) repeats